LATVSRHFLQAYTSACDRAILPGLHFHDLRRSWRGTWSALSFPSGANGEGRTPIPLREPDPKSGASANSATFAWVGLFPIIAFWRFRSLVSQRDDRVDSGCPPRGEVAGEGRCKAQHHYYGAFEQFLARSNLAAMLKAGGYLLSNDKLAERPSSGLDLMMTTEIPMTAEPVIITSYLLLPKPVLILLRGKPLYSVGNHHGTRGPNAYKCSSKVGTIPPVWVRSLTLCPKGIRWDRLGGPVSSLATQGRIQGARAGSQDASLHLGAQTRANTGLRRGRAQSVHETGQGAGPSDIR
jgi:hypothetical protein